MKIKKWLMIGAFILLAGSLQITGFAYPRGRGGMRMGHSERGEIHEGIHNGHRDRDFGRAYGGRIFIGPSPEWYWGWGWNPYGIWGPYYYPGPSQVEVRHVDYGTLEFKVKPEDTQIYIDNKLIGTVRSLDHHKAYAKQGNHEIMLKAPDGRTIDRDIYVAAGKKIRIKETL